MLAGLIFAIDEAVDRPGTLAATLPFGGMTLLEYQVRLLTGAGAGQVMVAVGRMTPALLNAVNRAVKRGAHVEVVRSAEEASEKIPPDARVLVLADGLVTTDPVIDRMAAEGAEALLVTDDPQSPAAIERLDMKDCWAGIARVTGKQLGEIATMPADYDFQSALLRVAVQAGAEHVMLTPGWAKSGHVVERSAGALATRGNAVLAALTERRTSWADRWVFNRIARMTLPWLTTRNVPGWALEAGGIALALGALGGIGWGWPGAGMVAALVSAALLAGGAAMAALGGQPKRADAMEIGITILFGAATLAVGAMTRIGTGDWTPFVLAIVAVAAQILVERSPVRHKRWWSSPAAHLLALTPFVLAHCATIGLAGIATYAFATLAAAVEGSREKA
ncbi:hypothetical protein OF829_10290 [Sphingomonas sp. LB-2]|uniref:hypothetical protein n=1 Tax=Sphingomonas caeni TaxID=2984949 RepID=UPI00222F0DCC|nr:hypothetical protein [Sphingomonas caeni]MCW3847632.1 hypothetical protein [Sphingomonas caeni]